MAEPLSLFVPHHAAACRVTYRMSDQMGVVYYGNYFEFFEIGRTELLRAVGFTYDQMERDGFFLPVARAEATYLAPARYDDLLRIETRLARLDRLRMDFDYRILRDGVTLCGGRTEHIITGPTGRPRRLNAEWVARITATMG